MNLDELRSAQAKERRKDSLQHLRDSFYDDVAAYVADLRAARDRRAEQVDKPFSDDDVRRLSDEVETAEEVAEALYERRVGKVVKLASFAAADMSVDADGMTTEERRLFDDLVERIKANKSSVLDVLSGEVSVEESGPDSTPASGPASEPDPAAESGPASEADPAPASDEIAGDGRAAEHDAADALAGAMGGTDDEGDDALDAPPDGLGEGADSPPPTDAPESPPPTDASGRDATDIAVEGAADGSAADEGATTDGGPTAVPPDPAPPGVDDDAGRLNDAGGSNGADPADGADEPGEAEPAVGDRTTVRITRDVGAIFGVDEREYDLASEDVVTLPVENAEPLVERDAAERLD